MAKSKRRKARRKTRKGGVFPRQTLQFVLICHGGNQQGTPEGQPDEFTVPNGVSVIMYVPAGMTCVSHLESPLTICRNGIPPQEIFSPGTLCPEYSLSTKDGESGGLYGCWTLNPDPTVLPTPMLTIPHGSSLREIVHFIQENYPMYNFELRCYFCRANASTTVYGANDELEQSNEEEFTNFDWNQDEENLDF